MDGTVVFVNGVRPFVCTYVGGGGGGRGGGGEEEEGWMDGC